MKEPLEVITEALKGITVPLHEPLWTQVRKQQAEWILKSIEEAGVAFPPRPTREQVETALFQLFPTTVRYDGDEIPNPGATDAQRGFLAGVEFATQVALKKCVEKRVNRYNQPEQCVLDEHTGPHAWQRIENAHEVKEHSRVVQAHRELLARADQIQRLEPGRLETTKQLAGLVNSLVISLRYHIRREDR